MGVLAGGLFVNRFSYRKQLILGWLLAIPAYALFVVAPSWEVVALASFVDWLSLLVLPAFNAYIVLALEGQEPAEAFTTIYSSLTAGMAITPALGGFLTATLGFRAPFVAALVCATVSWLCILLIRERTHRREAEVSRTSSGRGLARLARPFRTYTAALENRAFRDLLVILALGIGVPVVLWLGVTPHRTTLARAGV